MHGLEGCQPNNSDQKLIDFTVTRFLMKLFNINNKSIVDDVRYYFDFLLPSELLSKRRENFLMNFKACNSIHL